MSNYKRVPTSADVWNAIRARHPEMRVYGSYSAPHEGKMFTSYGFAQGDFPTIEAETTWDIDRENPHKRQNERHDYWLCLPMLDDV